MTFDIIANMTINRTTLSKSDIKSEMSSKIIYHKKEVEMYDPIII